MNKEVDAVRKLTMLAVVAALVGGLVHPVHASGARREESSYDFDYTKPGTTAWFGHDYGIFFGDAVEFRTKTSEKLVRLVVADDSGEPVTAGVWQEGSVSKVICERSDATIPIVGGKPVYVQVFVDVTFAEYDGCASPVVPTTGTVTATFTSR
jgi:hypothetical protein